MADRASTGCCCALRDAAMRWPSAPALIDAECTLTFAQLEASVDATAAAWRAAGCGPGAHVAILLARGPVAMIAILATMRLGAVACILSGRNPPAVLRAQREEARCTFRVTDESALAGVDAPSVTPLPLPLPVETPDGAPASPLVVPAPDAPATLIYTSGSAGKPKAAVHSYRNLTVAAQAAVTFNELRAGDRWLLSLPLWHVGGLSVLFRCLRAGAAVVIPAASETLGAALELRSVTHLSLVPTQLKRLLALPLAPASLVALRVLLLGGAPIPAALLAEAVARGWPVCATYGLTEMTSQVATVAAGATHTKRVQGPHPLPGVELHITAEGEILVRGPMLFLGYWEQGAVRLPLTPAGWFATGDLGHVQPGGGLAVIGRRDNLFISGGENIQPEEVEGALEALPGVDVAAVVALPDDEFGHRPCAYVRMHDGEPDGAALRAQLAARLPAFKIPIWFRAWPAQVDASAPKLARRALRDDAASVAAAAFIGGDQAGSLT
jgi:O-succinylbenzoic acid--CoA ligase